MSNSFNPTTYSQLLLEFQPKVIITEEECDRTLETVEKLMACKERTPEQTAILQLLVTLIEEFENKHYPIEPLLIININSISDDVRSLKLPEC